MKIKKQYHGPGSGAYDYRFLVQKLGDNMLALWEGALSCDNL